jgi:hypothetical protein
LWIGPRKQRGPNCRENLAAAVQIGQAMKTIAGSYRSAGRPPYEIDVRCSAALPRETPTEGRCQLFAGHDGPHAVMYVRCGKRTVRTWTTRDPGAVADVEVLQRPWMFGYPVPAWSETDRTPGSAN